MVCWESCSVDFLTHLPCMACNHNVVMVVVDRLSKQAHFVATRDTATAEDIVQLFYTHVFKHHGVPTSIVSDRDPKFTSVFWETLTKLLGTRLRMSSS